MAAHLSSLPCPDHRLIVRPRLLFLAQRMPFPPTKGEKIRALHTLLHFRQRYDIYVGCCVDDEADLPFVEELRALCAELYVARIHPRWGRLWSLRGLLIGDALTVAYFRDPGLSRWVRETMAQVRPEVVFAYSSNIAPLMLDLPRVGKRIVDIVDVDSEKFRAYSETAGFPMRWVYRREWRKIAALERRIAEDCDFSVLVSEPEAALFRALVPGHDRKVRGIGNGVDHAYFDPAIGFAAPYATDRPNYVFTGTMDYKPNIDAVGWFVADIFPVIRRALPDAQFHIVGANPAPDVQRLSRVDGVHVSGRVADVRPYIAHATAAVAPMRIARGIQNKVLEAMAMARPIVVTSQALEGITAVHGVEVLLADKAADFAAYCVRLATTGTEIGAAARQHVLAYCDWDTRLAAYDTLLDGLQPR